MSVSDLTPEQLEVLHLIQEDGVDASLSDAQRKIRNWLDDQGYIKGVGDEYDFEIYLTPKATLALEQADPNWWLAKRAATEKKISELRQRYSSIAIQHASAIEDIKREAAQRLEREKEWMIARIENTQEELSKTESEFATWLEENKDRFNG